MLRRCISFDKPVMTLHFQNWWMQHASGHKYGLFINIGYNTDIGHFHGYANFMSSIIISLISPIAFVKTVKVVYEINTLHCVPDKKSTLVIRLFGLNFMKYWFHYSTDHPHKVSSFITNSCCGNK